jgi:hypothetical protein
MNFSFESFDKELESLNRQLEVNVQHSNNVFPVKVKKIKKVKTTEKNIVVYKKKESEFIITEKESSNINTEVESKIPLKKKNLLSHRENKRLARLQRQENMKQERDAFFLEIKQKRKEAAKEQKAKQIIERTETKDILIPTSDIESIDKEIQTTVSQIIDIEDDFNIKLETINSDYKKEINQKDKEIEELKKQLNKESIKNKERELKLENELKDRLNARIVNQKNLDEATKQKKLLDKRIKKQQLILKQGKEELKKHELQFKELEKLKKEKINNIIQVVEEKYIESNNNKENKFLPDFQEVVLREKLKSINPSSGEYKRTNELLRIIVKKKKNRDTNFIKTKKRTVVKPVTTTKSNHKITIKSKKTKSGKKKVQKTSEIVLKSKILFNTESSFDERDYIKVEHLFNILSFRFLIFRNFSISFLDKEHKRLFSIFFRKDFTIGICQYKEEIHKRKIGNNDIKKEIVSDYTTINNKFKLWCVAWNGLININKDDFIENLDIEECETYYNIMLPNNTSFKYEKDGRELYYIKPDGKIIAKYI